MSTADVRAAGDPDGRHSLRLAGFVLRQLRAARGRAVALGLGLLVAGAGFSVLDSVSVSSAVAVQGTLNRNFQPAYDILVRPRGAVTALERSERLVNDGFLSDLYGGISMRQWQRILRLSGVSVAAPVENVGYAVTAVEATVNLRPLIGPGGQQMFRVVSSLVVHDGLAAYPVPDQYLYFSRDRWVEHPGGYIPSLVVSGHRKPLAACLTYLYPKAAERAGVFAVRALESMTCAGPDQRLDGGEREQQLFDPPGADTVQIGFAVPVLIAAIDPVQEAKLVGLSGAMVAGSYLREGEGLSAPIPLTSKDARRQKLVDRDLPMIASSRTFVDEALRVRVQRLDGPASGVRLPERLVAPGAGDYLDDLPGQTVLDRTYPSRGLYRRVLAQALGRTLGLGNYWAAGPVRYRVIGRRSLLANTLTNPVSVWQPIGSAAIQTSSAPVGANATQFRRLTPYDVSGAVNTLANGDHVETPVPEVQGTFDPDRLRGFAPLSRVPLGTFFPPTVTGATPTSRALLHGTPLGPTTDIAGYLAQPPLFLTTLKAAAPFFDSSVYAGNQPRGAPIAAIQVRVSGLHGASRASIARVKQVATEIYRSTHLQIDITAGSSPTPVDIDLPAGGFGQPPLAVAQGWVKKGVATVVLDAANAKNTALFVLILVAAALFVANAASAAVRQRRSEIATLTTLGWHRRQIFAAVLGEVLVIGLVAGVIGAGVAAAVIALAGLHFSLGRVLEVIPASVLVALVAGTVPAWSAARLSPLAGLSAPVRTRAAARRVRTITRLAWVNLTRLPWRTVLGGIGLVLGVGALAFLLAIQHAFSGTVAGDVLGNHIDVEVSSADYAAVALILLLAVGSVADVLIMNLRERSGELAALQACGWPDQSLRRLVITEGVTVGVIGALTGALAGLGGAWLLGADPGAVAGVTAIAFVAGVLVCATAVLPALSALTRQMPAVTLSPE
ncbi:MAG: FtsX-like permease family protein [Solirubrobacteraceae bacterium]